MGVGGGRRQRGGGGGECATKNEEREGEEKGGRPKKPMEKFLPLWSYFLEICCSIGTRAFVAPFLNNLLRRTRLGSFARRAK